MTGQISPYRGAAAAGEEVSGPVVRPPVNPSCVVLPHDLWVNAVGPYLSSQDLCALRGTCRRFTAGNERREGIIQEIFEKRIAIQIQHHSMQIKIRIEPPTDGEGRPSFEGFIQFIGGMPQEILNAFKAASPDLIKKILSAVQSMNDNLNETLRLEDADPMALIISELSSTGECHQFIRAAFPNLTPSEQKFCEELCKKFYKIFQSVLSMIVFGIKEQQSFEQNQEASAAGPPGENQSEDIQPLSEHRLKESELLAKKLHDDLREKFKEGIQSCDEYLQDLASRGHLNDDELAGLREGFLTFFKDVANNLILPLEIVRDFVCSSREVSCGNFLNGDEDIVEFLGVLFLSGQYTLEEIRDLLAGTRNEIPEAQLFRLLELIKDSGAILLQHIPEVNVNSMRWILSRSPVSEEVLQEAFVKFSRTVRVESMDYFQEILHNFSERISTQTLTEALCQAHVSSEVLRMLRRVLKERVMPPELRQIMLQFISLITNSMWWPPMSEEEPLVRFLGAIDADETIGYSAEEVLEDFSESMSTQTLTKAFCQENRHPGLHRMLRNEIGNKVTPPELRQIILQSMHKMKEVDNDDMQLVLEDITELPSFGSYFNNTVMSLHRGLYLELRAVRGLELYLQLRTLPGFWGLFNRVQLLMTTNIQALPGFRYLPNRVQLLITTSIIQAATVLVLTSLAILFARYQEQVLLNQDL